MPKRHSWAMIGVFPIFAQGLHKQRYDCNKIVCNRAACQLPTLFQLSIYGSMYIYLSERWQEKDYTT